MTTAPKLEKVKRHPGIYQRGSRYVAVARDHRRRQVKRFAKTIAEAELRRSEIRVAADRHEPQLRSRISFAQYAAEWIGGPYVPGRSHSAATRYAQATLTPGSGAGPTLETRSLETVPSLRKLERRAGDGWRAVLLDQPVALAASRDEEQVREILGALVPSGRARVRSVELLHPHLEIRVPRGHRIVRFLESHPFRLDARRFPASACQRGVEFVLAGCQCGLEFGDATLKLDDTGRRLVQSAFKRLLGSGRRRPELGRARRRHLQLFEPPLQLRVALSSPHVTSLSRPPSCCNEALAARRRSTTSSCWPMLVPRRLRRPR